MKRFLIIFAKEPQKGKVKTRLNGCLSGSQSLILYKAFLKDTLGLIRKIDCEVKVLAYDSSGKNPVYLKKVAGRLMFYKQRGRSLGEKMHNAVKFAAEKNAAKIVIIGSDSPNLPAGYIKKAFERLDKSDVVIGPSYDGGYYLIGLKEPCFGIFKGIRWSSETVFENTVKNAEKLGKSTAILGSWYDIDEPADLVRLKKDLRKPQFKGSAPWTKRFMKRNRA